MAPKVTDALAVGRAASRGIVTPKPVPDVVDLPAPVRMLAAVLGQHFANVGHARAGAIAADLLRAGYLVVPIYSADLGETRAAADAYGARFIVDKERAAGWTENDEGAYQTIVTGRVWLAIATERALTLYAIAESERALLAAGRSALHRPGMFAADLARMETDAEADAGAGDPDQ